MDEFVLSQAAVVYLDISVLVYVRCVWMLKFFFSKKIDFAQDRTGDVLRVKQMP